MEFHKNSYICRLKQQPTEKSKPMNKISATIITLNEQDNIERCLNSLHDVADEIIVVDSHSTDATVEICKRYNCHVVTRDFTGYGTQRQYATSLTAHSYVLAIDADEVLDEDLRHAILALKKDGRIREHRVYAMPLANHYFGRLLKHGYESGQTRIRLFNKRYAQWNLRDVGERVMFADSLRPQILNGSIVHYRCASIDEFNRKEDHQAVIKSEVLAARNSRIGVLAPLAKGLNAWTTSYLRHKGWMNGKSGLAIANGRFRSTKKAYSLARKKLQTSVK